MRVRRAGRSKSVDGVLRALKRTAGGAVLANTAATMAPQLQKAMRALLRPHKDTGKAESTATASASGSTITLENIGYAKYVKDYAFGRRLPRNWVVKIQRKAAADVRAEIRRFR